MAPARSPPAAPATLLVVLLALCSGGLAQVTQCDKKTACSCATNNGDIDLSPLSGSPRTVAGQSPDETYYYDPCKNFAEGSVSSAALIQQNGGGYYEIGTVSDATTISGIDPTTGLPYFLMVASDAQRMGQVACVCDQSQDFNMAYQGEQAGTPITYEFTLTSKYCCPNSGPAPPTQPGPPGPGPNTGGDGGDGLSAGSLLVIGFFALTVVYVGAGIAFQKGVRKASGKEIVPNIGFWSVLPGLVWTGIKFTFTCGRKSGYGQI